MAWVLALLASLFCALSGACFVFLWAEKREEGRLRQARKAAYLGEGSSDGRGQTVAKGLSPLVIGKMEEYSRVFSLKPGRRRFTGGIWNKGTRRLDESIRMSGAEGRLSAEGFIGTRARFALGGFAIGFFVGLLFSTELGLCAGIAGFFLGWGLPGWSLRKESEARRLDLERHLSEMIEVVALGLRSGLSFDRAFELYHLHFESNLAFECSSAQAQWNMGLSTREDALRRLTARYGSPLFNRMVENIIRSLRFGASLAESLEASALEARALHKAYMEEKVAKAPVKMMVPTAALILPAMLLLVLGPVILDMMKGF